MVVQIESIQKVKNKNQSINKYEFDFNKNAGINL